MDFMRFLKEMALVVLSKNMIALLLIVLIILGFFFPNIMMYFMLVILLCGALGFAFIILDCVYWALNFVRNIINGKT